MEIRIDNWNDNETVNYKIVLIKGVILINNQVLNNIKEESIKCISEVTTEWPVFKGNLKCLAKLKPGTNQIKLQYKETIKELTIKFKCNETELCITPVYLICDGHDGRFQGPSGCDNSVESAYKRISLGVSLIQCIFAEKLREQGFDRKSFQLESDLNDQVPKCRIFNSNLHVDKARSWKEQDLWEFFGRELMCSDLGSENKKFLAFLSCTIWDGTKALGNPALGGGGLALLGSASLYTWPEEIQEIVSCFTNEGKIGPNLLDNSCYRGTYGGCFSTSLGAACHELGHMFNLGHTPSGIMSRGFDHIGRVFISGDINSKYENKKDNIDLLPCLSVVTGAPSKTNLKILSSINNQKNEEDDLTHLTKSCATFLAHHRWFNSNSGMETTIEYDSIRSLLSSEVGLKVVQLRGSCGAVIKSWELGSKSPHKHLILPKLNLNPATLIAMDSNGHILTVQI